MQSHQWIQIAVEVVEAPSVSSGLGGVFAQTEIVVVKADGTKCPRCWNYRTINWLLAQFGDRKKAKRQKVLGRLAAWRAESKRWRI